MRLLDWIDEHHARTASIAAALALAALPLLGLPTVVWAGVLGVALLTLLACLIVLVARRFSTRSVAQGSSISDDEKVAELAQEELVLMVDEAKSLIRFFDGPGYGATQTWIKKADAFLEAVFGPLERQRFQSKHGLEHPSIEGSLNLRMRALENLRDRPETWELQLGEVAFADAVARRRHLTIPERIALGGREKTVTSHGVSLTYALETKLARGRALFSMLHESEREDTDRHLREGETWRQEVEELLAGHNEAWARYFVNETEPKFGRDLLSRAAVVLNGEALMRQRVLMKLRLQKLEEILIEVRSEEDRGRAEETETEAA